MTKAWLRPIALLGPMLSALLLAPLESSCAPKSISQAPAEDPTPEIVLAPGASSRLSDTDSTVTFEQIVEDSRCPQGVTCIYAGNATARVRINSPGLAPFLFVLHTNIESGREVEYRGLRIKLLRILPFPVGDARPRPDEYRVTLSIEKK